MPVRMMCIANSRKEGGRCLAGVNLDNGQIIRPVNPGGEALTASQVRCDDGTDIRPLDVVIIELDQRQPLNYQPENYLVGDYDVLHKQYNFDFNHIYEYCCDSNNICHNCLFYNDNSKAVSTNQINRNSNFHSLSLLSPENLLIEKRDRSRFDTGPQIRAQFMFANKEYNLPITDDTFKGQFYREEYDCGFYRIDNNQIILTISLGSPFEEDGNHYKLVAAVIINGNYNIERHVERFGENPWDYDFDVPF